jgi:hypothetical protein
LVKTDGGKCGQGEEKKMPVDVLVSWNFQQIVNLDRIHAFNAVNLMFGYPMLEIRSPREIVYEKDV